MIKNDPLFMAEVIDVEPNTGKIGSFQSKAERIDINRSKTSTNETNTS